MGIRLNLLWGGRQQQRGEIGSWSSMVHQFLTQAVGNVTDCYLTSPVFHMCDMCMFMLCFTYTNCHTGRAEPLVVSPKHTVLGNPTVPPFPSNTEGAIFGKSVRPASFHMLNQTQVKLYFILPVFVHVHTCLWWCFINVCVVSHIIISVPFLFSRLCYDFPLNPLSFSVIIRFFDFCHLVTCWEKCVFFLSC